MKHRRRWDSLPTGAVCARRRRLLAAALFSLAAPVRGNARAADLALQHLYLNTAFGPPVAGGNGFFDHVVALMFGPLGYTVSVRTPPAERALMLANAGIDDGDGPRIPGLAQEYPNLVPIPEPVLEVEFVAFTRLLRFETDGWQSLEPYSVAIVTGWKILERNIAGAAELLRVKDPEHLFNLLREGRTEVAVIDRLSGYAICRKMGLRDFNVLEPPLAKMPMYLYLHNKHASLIPSATRNLRELKASGLYRRLFQETFSNVHADDSDPRD